MSIHIDCLATLEHADAVKSVAVIDKEKPRASFSNSESDSESDSDSGSKSKSKSKTSKVVVKSDISIATGSSLTAKIWKYEYDNLHPRSIPRSITRASHTLSVSYNDEINSVHTSDYDVRAVAFDSHGNLAAGGCKTKMWWANPDRMTECWSVNNDSSVSSLAFNPTNQYMLATGHLNGYVKLWNLSDNRETLYLEPRSERQCVNSVAFNPAGTILVAGSSNGTAVCWSTANAVRVMMTISHSQPITCVAFNSKGTRLAIGGGNTVKLWRWSLEQVASPTCEATLPVCDNIDTVNSLAFHPINADVLATGSSDKTAKLWSFFSPKDSITVSWNCFATLNAHSESITSLGFSPTGLFLATGSDDKTAKLWDCKMLSDISQRMKVLTGVSGFADMLLSRLSRDRTTRKTLSRYLKTELVRKQLMPGTLFVSSNKRQKFGGTRVKRSRTRSKKRKRTTLRHKKRKRKL